MNNLIQKNRMLLVAFLRTVYEVWAQRKMILPVMLFIAAFGFNVLAQQTKVLSEVSTGVIIQDLKSIEQLLNSDGTINQNAKATGSFDVSNYEMTYGENGEPVFSQKANNAITTGEGVWSDQFPGPPGANNSISVVVKDASNNIYIGGTFTIVCGVYANRIAKWNGSEWSALGSGIGYSYESSSVTSIVIDGSGNVYAGGYFTSAGGVPASNIAKWDGSGWSALGTGSNNTVKAMAIDVSGNLYAGGDFTSAGGVTALRIAKWDGSAWSALGTGIGGFGAQGGSPSVRAIAISGSNVYVGGAFTTAGGVTSNKIAKWNGSAWSALGTGINGIVHGIAIDGIGNVYVGGIFTNAGGVSANNIAKWNNSEWSALGTGILSLNCQVNAVAIDANNNIYAGGYYTIAGGIAANNIAKWNGSEWSAVGIGLGLNYDGAVLSIAFDGSSNIYAVGSFKTAGDVNVNRIAKWNGSAWLASVTSMESLGTGIGSTGPSLSGTVRAMAIDLSGNVYVGGDFTTAGGVATSNIAKWNGSEWSALGSGLNNSVNSIAIDGSGNVYAGGIFSSYISKWNGSAWSALGTGINNSVTAIVIDNNNNVYAGGWFTTAGGVSANRIAKWNGSAWSALGTGLNGTSNVAVYSLAIEGSSNLYVGGNFTTAGGIVANNIAKWNGSSWSALGTGLDNYVLAIAIDGSNKVYAGGGFSDKIAKWNGSTWTNYSSGLTTNGSVNAIAIDGNSNVYAGGSFTSAGGITANRIAKWDGSTWSTLGTGLDNAVFAVKTYNDLVYCGGNFIKAGNISSSYFGKYSTIVTAPEIDVKQATTAIADGTGTFDFGSKSTASNTDIVFTIENTGTAASTLGSFTISGANADQFSVQGSTPTTVSAGGTTTFTVRFTPASAGAKTAAVSFINEDADENPYNFSITGTGVAPIQVDANSSSSTLGLTSDSDVEVAAGVTLTLDANTVINKLILAPTASLSMGSNTLNAANGIVLQSSAGGNATILGDNPISNATVEQYVTAGRNWIISSPITNAGYEVLNRGVSVGEWNEATKNWYPKLSGTLTSGKGYIQFANAVQTGTTGTLRFEGNTNAGNIDVSVTRTGSGISSGYNLVGNPYPSYLNWSDLIADASNANINRSFWYATQNTIGRYTIVTYNGVGDISVTGNGTANTAISAIIPPMQGFWVRVNSDMPSTTVSFTNEMREHRDTYLNIFKAPKVDARASLRLQLTDGTQSDETMVYFDVNASNAYDEYDSPKMMNNSIIEPDLYTVSGSERLVINGLKDLTDNLELTLGFNLNTTATMKLKVSELLNFESGTHIYLLDKVENSQTVLNPDTEYNFSTTTTSTYIEDRFSLLFRTQNINTDIDKAGVSPVNVFVDADNQLNVTAPLNSSYIIYNATGQKINEGRTISNLQTMNLKNQTGMFIVRVYSNGKEFTTRLIIK